MRVLIRQARRFHVVIRLTVLSLLTGILVITWAPHASGQIPDLSIPRAPSNQLPNEVTRYGSIEVAAVQSPIDNADLFEVAAPTIYDRSRPNTTPVEVRAAEVKANLRRAMSRLNQFLRQPQVAIATLNEQPLLQVTGANRSRPLRLIAVTESDADYYGEPATAVAQRWQKILQQELDRGATLFSPEVFTERVVQALQILLAMLSASGCIWFCNRLLKARRQALKAQRQTIKPIPSDPRSDGKTGPPQSDDLGMRSAAVHTGSPNTVFPNTGSPNTVSPNTGSPNTAFPNTAAPNTVSPNTAASDTSNAEGEEVATNRFHFLTDWQNQFSLGRRLDINSLLQWLLFWALVLIWYIGTIWIVSIVPGLMLYRELILGTPIELLLIWFFISLAIRISHSLIDRFMNAWKNNPHLTLGEVQRKALRTATIAGAMKSLVTFLLASTGLLWTLNTLRIPTGSIVAGGALIGLAFSFGSQNLIKDLVNGCLILLEDQFAVGDVIDLGKSSGLVENWNLRVTQLRDAEGRLITIPNSSITEVKNLTRLWSRVDFSIEVAYETNPKTALALLNTVAQTMYNEPEWRSRIPDPPEVLGIDGLSNNGMLLRVWIKTVPLEQWRVAREFRYRVRMAFESQGIQIGRPEWINHNINLEIDPDTDAEENSNGNTPSELQKNHSY